MSRDGGLARDLGVEASAAAAGEARGASAQRQEPQGRLKAQRQHDSRMCAFLSAFSLLFLILWWWCRREGQAFTEGHGMVQFEVGPGTGQQRKIKTLLYGTTKDK